MQRKYRYKKQKNNLMEEKNMDVKELLKKEMEEVKEEELTVWKEMDLTLATGGCGFGCQSVN